MENFSIRIEELGKHLGKRTVLRNVSFAFEKGVLGLAGSNGSGKSTLLKCMAGLWSPSTGKVIWDIGGRQVGRESFKQRLGYAAPYVNLYNELTCYENLHFILELRDYAGKNDKIKKILRQTSMDSFCDQLYRYLSTGQQQRIKLAAALVHEPDILFLDEPGTNLDKAGRAMIRSIVEAFKEEGNLVVIASNNEDELSMCDKVFSVEEERFNES